MHVFLESAFILGRLALVLLPIYFVINLLERGFTWSLWEVLIRLNRWFYARLDSLDDDEKERWAAKAKAYRKSKGLDE